MKKGESKAHPKDGRRLKILRETIGKTQEELADELSVSVGTIYNYECGKNEIPTHIWRYLLGKYGANPVPENPDEDPSLFQKYMLSIVRGRADEEPNPEPAIQPVEKSSSILARVKSLRERNIYIKTKLFSPLRRKVDTAIGFCYLTSFWTFTGEYIRHYFEIGGGNLSLYHDYLYVGSCLSTTLMMVVVLSNIPWGIKPP